ncbi:MAG: S-methyl-5-thioribose-1-phosphate isomerase [bacterium]
MFMRTIEWKPDTPESLIPGKVVMIDQTRLPLELTWLKTSDVKEVWHAIKTLQVRGAPAIGIAAAMGVATSIQNQFGSTAQLAAAARLAADYLATSRPTAVNLFWALDRMRTVILAAEALTPASFKTRLVEEAMTIRDEDAAMCRAIGKHGATLLKDGDTILTHCNAGGLATAEYGTALAPIYVATEQGKRIHVYADETRPLLQGARLTAWELMQAGVEVTLICDNMAAHVMKTRTVNAVFVGADRIAANGDSANKIGTYGLAVLSRAHGIPFYVLAPSSTFDLSLQNGAQIPIEERAPEEITMGFGKRTAPENVKTYSPAFDVTPGELITGIVCEQGVISPPYWASFSSRFAPTGQKS